MTIIVTFIFIHGIYEITKFENGKKKTLLALNLNRQSISPSTKKSDLIKQLIRLKKEASVHHIFIEEENIQQLINNGQLSIISGAELKNSFRIGRAFRSAIYRLKKNAIQTPRL